MGMLMIRCPKTGRAISTGGTSNPGYSAAPLYFSAAPTVHTAGRGMSGLSKTHGFAIPTGLNVNSWGRRRRVGDYVKAAAQPLNIPGGKAIETLFSLRRR